MGEKESHARMAQSDSLGEWLIALKEQKSSPHSISLRLPITKLKQVQLPSLST